MSTRMDLLLIRAGIMRMGRLVNAGITPEIAARIARNASDADGCGYYRLGSGLMLKIYREAA